MPIKQLLFLCFADYDKRRQNIVDCIQQVRSLLFYVKNIRHFDSYMMLAILQIQYSFPPNWYFLSAATMIQSATLGKVEFALITSLLDSTSLSSLSDCWWFFALFTWKWSDIFKHISLRACFFRRCQVFIRRRFRVVIVTTVEVETPRQKTRQALFIPVLLTKNVFVRRPANSRRETCWLNEVDATDIIAEV